MNIQYDARVLSSLSLLVDYKLLKIGQAYTNYSGALYPVNTKINGLYAYGTPFKQLVNDTSITGATIMSGVYLDGTFIKPGTSGFYGINHYDGIAYFTSPITNPQTRLSGNYAYKDFSVKLTDMTDYKLLFGSKYLSNQVYAQNPTGVPEDVEIFPIIYIRATDIENRPFGFAGLDDNTMHVRCVMIAEDMFSVIGVSNILKDLNLKTFTIYNTLPFNQMGMYTGVNYNYENLQGLNYNPLIWKVKVTNINPRSDDFNLYNKKTMFVDFEIRTLSTHN